MHNSRIIKVWCRYEETWKKIHPSLLDKLDVVVLFEHNNITVNHGQIYVLAENPSKNEQSIWGFKCIPVDGCFYTNDDNP